MSQQHLLTALRAAITKLRDARAAIPLTHADLRNDVLAVMGICERAYAKAIAPDAGPVMRVYREFATAENAREYRHTYGTGGWIFAAVSGPVYLFPPELQPSAIFMHPLTKGLTGQLIGAA